MSYLSPKYKYRIDSMTSWRILFPRAGASLEQSLIQDIYNLAYEGDLHDHLPSFLVEVCDFKSDEVVLSCQVDKEYSFRLKAVKKFKELSN